ncbi:MAG: DUF2799 domain-containing protein [Bacteriovorax sp.]|nr:DUF2799 domain-containing protein [Bacteriovorax sp.]
MKKILPISLAIFVLILTTSCSSVISKNDCKKDMNAFGLDHGKHGLSSLADELRRVCTTGESSVDLQAYQTGFNMGWSDFCTTFHGFEMGRKGDLYKSFCPLDKEELFHEKFLIGKKVYEKNDQVTEIEEKIKDLNPQAAQDLSKKEELIKIKDYLLALKREIQGLEQKGRSLIHTN